MPTTVEQTHTLRITRRFKASRERVFAAFTTLEAMAEWFGPPGRSCLGDSVDFRVGGSYRLRVRTPDGEEMIVCGIYREITPPSKLAFTWRWEDDEDWAKVESEITIEFHAHGSETEISLTQIGFPAVENRDRHSHGWNACFDKLEAALAA
jgi:uncharacterized protein YndB with AHSA1/START domain